MPEGTVAKTSASANDETDIFLMSPGHDKRRPVVEEFIWNLLLTLIGCHKRLTGRIGHQHSTKPIVSWNPFALMPANGEFLSCAWEKARG